MVQDVRAVDDATHVTSLQVPNSYLALQNLTPGPWYFTVVDLANAFILTDDGSDSCATLRSDRRRHQAIAGRGRSL